MNTIMNIWNKLINAVDKKIVKFILPAHRCVYCWKETAVWKNSISNVCACDKCVPKNCMCRILNRVNRATFLIQNQSDKINKTGKRYPCEDWQRI